MIKFASFCVLVYCLLSGAAFAQSQQVIENLISCKGIADDNTRLRCLDNVLEDLNVISPPAQSLSNVIDEASVNEKVEEVAVLGEADEQQKVEAFGQEDIAIKQRKNNKERPKILEASLIELAKNKNGKYVMILDNGQVWRQLKSDTSRLSLGRNEGNVPVTIKRRALGGYAFSLARDKRSVKVERLK